MKRARSKRLEDQIYSRLLMLQAIGNSKDMKIMAWSTFEGQFLGKLIYVFKLWVFFQIFVMFYAFGLWALFYKLVYIFMFFGLGLLVGFLYAYIQRYQKTNVDTLSHILNLISLKKGFSLFFAQASSSYQRLTSLWRIFT